MSDMDSKDINTMSPVSNGESGKVQPQNPRVTWEGCSVLLDINDGDRVVFSRLSHGATIKIGNKSCSLKPLIGCPFGTLFQVESGNNGPYLSRVAPSTEGNMVEDNVDCKSVEESRDNRELVDDNKAQSLTSDEIDAMRRQGATGNEIVEALIANSTTFEKKTLFSQEKYRRKKQKKYAPKVLLRRPFARSICEAYFKKHPSKTGFLRVDTLSLLLSMANVTPSSDVLVVDMVSGLLTGAVAERLGGKGYVCNTYLGETPYPMDIVRIFNLSDDICKRIVRSPSKDLCLSQNGYCEHSGLQEDCNAENKSTEEYISSTIGMEEVSTISDSEKPATVSETSIPETKTCKTTKAGEKASHEAIKSWQENGFSSLMIVAPELDPWSIVKDLLPLLSYSAPFVIYHQYLQPLATCMHNLQVGRMAIGLQITEPWLREYQVLPSRTHPCMQMSSFGGYVLSGTRIYST